MLAPAAQIGGGEITVAKVDPNGVETAQVKMAEVAGCQLAWLAL
jgi:hypothetical protein